MTFAAVDPATVGRAGTVALTAAVALWAVLSLRRVARAGSSGFESAVSCDTTPSQRRPHELEQLERLVAFSANNAGDLHYRLRPILRDIADHQLRLRHGVDLASDPDRARAVLGEDLYELVRLDRPEPENRLAPGIEPARLSALVDRLDRR